VVRAYELPDSALFGEADLRSAMAARVEERVDRSIVVADDDDGRRSDGEREVVAGRLGAAEEEVCPASFTVNVKVPEMVSPSSDRASRSS